MYDFLIIGGGPAGLAAALFGRRKHLKTILLEKNNEVGGHLWHSYGSKPVVDYPGFPEGITGYDLVKRFREHAEKEGAEIHTGEPIERIEPWEPGYRVHTGQGRYFDALCILIAIGTAPRRLGLPHEKEFANKSIFYSFNSPEDFRGKSVLVIGGGNSALEVAMGLKDTASDVKLLHRSKFRADEGLQHEFLESGVPYELGVVVTGLHGENELEAVTIRNLETGEEYRRQTDALISCTGLAPGAGFLEDLGVQVNERGYIITDADQQTNVRGILAAGDITGGTARLATAIGQGVTASHTAHRYVKDIQIKLPQKA